jgi:hypothetical protein
MGCRFALTRPRSSRPASRPDRARVVLHHPGGTPGWWEISTRRRANLTDLPRERECERDQVRVDQSRMLVDRSAYETAVALSSGRSGGSGQRADPPSRLRALRTVDWRRARPAGTVPRRISQRRRRRLLAGSDSPWSEAHRAAVAASGVRELQAPSGAITLTDERSAEFLHRVGACVTAVPPFAAATV